MKQLLTIAVICVSQFCFAQKNQKKSSEKFSAEDSICRKKATAMMQQVKQAGEYGKYLLSEELLVTMLGSDSTGDINISILNLGPEKSIEIEIVSLLRAGKDPNGNASYMRIDNPYKIPLPPNYRISGCQTVNFKQHPLFQNNINFNRIHYMKLAVYLDHEENILELGREQ